MLLKNSGHYCRMSLTLYFCHQSEVTHYWEGYHRGDKPFTAPHITSYTISKCLITDHVNLYHLDEVLCLLGLLIVKLLFFPLSFTSILGGRYSMQITFSPPYIPTNVLFISASCLQPLLCSSNGDFCSLILFFLKILFIYFQKPQCVVASHMLPTGYPAQNPGMCPDWESNWQPFDLQFGAQSTEPHQPGLFPHSFQIY